MRLLMILALVASAILPVLPAAAQPRRCTLSSSSPNEGSTLSSTSEGGNPSCGVPG